MSLKPTLRERRLKKIYNTSSKLTISTKINSEDSKVRLVNPLISTAKFTHIPNLHVKLLSLPNEDIATSRRKLGGLLSTKTSKRINLSMGSPSSHILKTGRSRGLNSFCFSQRKSIQYPTAPETVLDYAKDSLSDYEKQEILDYESIYFIGAGAEKVQKNAELPNYGFDNEKNEYKIVTGDHFEYRYEVLAMLGRGSFGQVCKCIDHKTKEIVAVKVVKNKRKFHKQGMVEIKLLKQMRDLDPEENYNIVRVINHFVFRNHLCIVFELLSISLYDLVKQSNFRGISLSVVSRFAVQILLGLQYAHSLNIIHCDLKPENILLKSAQKCGLKIIDFGSGCYANEKIYTYIQSRFYRAPEIMLGIPYTQAIDMWSFGCIMVELYIGYPIFPGEDEQEQFLRIVEVLGLPPHSLLEESSRKSVFYDSNGKIRIVPNSRGKIRYPGSRSFEDFVGVEQPLFVEFIQEILQWTPELRPTAAEALKHPWIQNFIRKPALPSKRKVIKSIINVEGLIEES
jgi:dual specificity tyrosine-phosphorylation-regulated kinase 2/3/4